MKSKKKCNHKKFREHMILYLYEELSPGEKNRLEAHNRECPACAAEFHRLQEDHAALNRVSRSMQPPAFDWMKSWWQIRRGLREKTPAGSSRFPALKVWAPRLAAAVVIFALGIFVGKLIFFSPPQPQPGVSSGAAHGLYLASMYREHFDEVKTVVLEYANYRANDRDSRLLSFEKSRMNRLLSRNRLLKQYIKGEKYMLLKQLLDELEMILIEISNLTGDDPESLRFIKELLKEKEIIFKMKYFKFEKIEPTKV